MKRKSLIARLGGNALRMILSAEFFVTLLAQDPVSRLARYLGFTEYRYAAVLLTAVAVYCLGALVRRKFGFRSLIGSLE